MIEDEEYVSGFAGSRDADCSWREVVWLAVIVGLIWLCAQMGF